MMLFDTSLADKDKLLYRAFHGSPIYTQVMEQATLFMVNGLQVTPMHYHNTRGWETVQPNLDTVKCMHCQKRTSCI